MGRYFFHILDGNDLIEDPDGSDLPDDGVAHDEALRSARFILADAISSGREPTGQALVVVNEQGRIVDKVRFVDALPPKVKQSSLGMYVNLG